jgi:hypothetical protein
VLLFVLVTFGGHKYEKTRSVWAMGYAGVGTVCKFYNHGYTVPVTTLSWVLVGISQRLSLLTFILIIWIFNFWGR